ncbi:hypothetical protein [Pseudohaliea sp.]|uniref:hypothetical protein n=1 Tax=Pseudohaliea sp. TaxID=2740289 RepID=UPI0032EF5ED0
MRTLPIVITLIACLASSLANGAAYIRGASAPWGENTNETAMDTVFGAGGWDDLRMADGATPFTSGAHDFIFLEGGDSTANELSTYLTTYRTEIEAFVSSGGALLLNAAPNQGGNINYGFGGVTLTYPAFTSDVVAASPGHPVFNGPFTPVVTSYSGSSFGHAIVGNGLSPIIIGAPGDTNEGETVLGERNFGSGLVLLGGMTTDNFHDPQPEAANLRANIIAYTAAGGDLNLEPEVVPATPVWSIAMLAILMLLAAGLRRRAGHG